MKSNKYQRRFYRDWAGHKDLCSARVVDKETDLVILTDKPLERDFAKERVRFYRRQLENYIAKDPRFLTALKPLAVELNAPLIVKEMSRQAKKAGVGPMAAVAGAVASFLGKDLLAKGYKEVIVENGGDIFLATRKTRSIAIYAGKSKLWRGLALVVNPQDTPLGICASSGTIGHSLSFGSADSVVILAKNAVLADAVATATCNRICSKEDLNKALDFAKSIKGISGVVAIIKNNFIGWGKVSLGNF
jgi:ApbE superfamily uncharacterized protein (UPF0280 family)